MSFKDSVWIRQQLRLIIRPFYSGVNQKRYIFTHLPNLQTFFSASYSLNFSFKMVSDTLHTLLHTFSIFGSPTFGFCSQSAREVSKSLKIGEEGVSSALSVMFLDSN